jgi:hypothetical protein
MTERMNFYLPIPTSKAVLLSDGCISIPGYANGEKRIFQTRPTKDLTFYFIETSVDDFETIKLAKSFLGFTGLTQVKMAYYVYSYSDPENDSCPFYIGKGKNNRCYDHLFETSISTSRKVRTIQSILKRGEMPHIQIIRCGLKDEEEAYSIECALIDVFREIPGVRPEHEPLTNKVRGRYANELGIRDAQQMNMTYDLKYLAPEDFDQDTIITTVNGTYTGSDSISDLAKCTLGDWNIGAHRNETLVLGAYCGIVVSVFCVEPDGISEVSRSGRVVRRRWTKYRPAPEDIWNRYYHKSIEHLFPLTGQKRREWKLIKKYVKP